jgi:putative heme-binding domain-containing protein
LVEGPVEGGGRSSGYFTGATGVTIYRGNAFPGEFSGNVFIGECGGNLVHRKLLLPDDVSLKGERPPDEQKTEFLSSTDNWFRPVQFANAPDGTLYMIDMHREIVEHPWSLPDGIKKLLDLNSGSECGRIFRIVPDGFQQPKAPRLNQATTGELVATLENPNGWHRDTASRLLYERRDPEAASLLAGLLARSQSAVAKVHALYALEGLGALRASNVVAALGDQAAWVRVHALSLAETLPPSERIAVFPLVRGLAADSSDLVRYQAAFTLGEFPGEEAFAGLGHIARQDAGSRWIRAAVLSSLGVGAEKVFTDLSRDAAFAGSLAGRDFLGELAGVIGGRNLEAEVAGVLRFAAGTSDDGLAFPVALGLGEGLKRAHSSLERADSGGTLKLLMARAARLAADRQSDQGHREQAIKLLGLAGYAEAGPVMSSLLDSRESESMQLAGIAALGRFSEAEVSPVLLQHWSGFSPRARSLALSVLLARKDRATALLQAIEDGKISRSELATSQVKLLRTHGSQEIRRRAVNVFGEVVANPRQAVIEAYQPALQLRGEAAAGRRIFSQRCVACHRLGGEGFAVGPDLVTVKNTGKEKLLVNILDPSREVAPPYIAFEIETKDGESLLGILANETLASVTVRQGYGKEEVVPRANVQGMRSQGQSLMPEGLEQGLSAQEFADLLEYLSTANADK